MADIDVWKYRILSHVDGYLYLDALWRRWIEPLWFRQQLSQGILLLLLLVGMLHPTSVCGDISVIFRRSSLYLLNLLLFLMLVLNGLGDRLAYRCSLGIPFILALATFLSPLQEAHPGAYVAFLPMSLLFSINLRDIPWARIFSIGFIFVNIIIIASSFAVIFDVQEVERVYINYYNAYTQYMLKNMCQLGKPVLFFSSHSISSFIYTLMFFLNFKIFLHKKSYIYLIFSLCFVVIIYFLRSNSAYFSLLIILMILCYYTITLARSGGDRKRCTLWLIISGVVLLLTWFFWGGMLENFFTDFFAMVQTRLSSPGSGFLGRYSPHGVLAGNIRYILENPFSPSGLCSSPEFWYMDSGGIEYMLRGSVFLVVAVYYGLFRFLSFHLPTGLTYWFVFFLIVINESGFPYLKYFRFMYFLPFFIVYLRHLEVRYPVRHA